ncbi:hypothetical protein, partial [Demequina mangrovi]|uniref:hypothetical protein n=1 Tax=Demequina mangrovi TaxID=1043493 RepID=UPI001F40D26A
MAADAVTIVVPDRIWVKPDLRDKSTGCRNPAPLRTAELDGSTNGNPSGVSTTNAPPGERDRSPTTAAGVGHLPGGMQKTPRCG